MIARLGLSALARTSLLATLACVGPVLAQVEPGRVENLAGTNTTFELQAPSSRGAWEWEAEQLRQRVRWAVGLLPAPPRRPLHPILGPVHRGRGFAVRAFALESAPELWVRGTLYAPLDAKGARPVVLCPHGHWKRGRFQDDVTCSVRARCVALARRGAYAVSWDMLGFGESAAELRHRQALLENEAAELWGLGPLQLQTWNSLRVLDFACALPDADPQRIAVTGASGGGTQSFVLAAVDERVDVSVPVNMVSATMQGGCTCENAPGLRWTASNPSIAALFAPRPQLLVSASGDWTKNTPEHEFPYLRAVYGLYEAQTAVANAHFDAPHNYDASSRAAVYAFFEEHLFKGQAKSEWDEGDLPEDEALQLPAELLPVVARVPIERRVASLREELRRAVAEYAPLDAARLASLRELVDTSLQLAIGSHFSTRVGIGEVQTDARGTSQCFVREGRSVRWGWPRDGLLVSELKESPDRLAVIVHPDGLRAAQSLASKLAKLERMGWTPVLVEPFGTGGSRPDPTRSERAELRFLTTFHRSDAGETVFDLVTFLGALPALTPGRRNPPRVRLIGLGEQGSSLLAAACFLPEKTAELTALEVLVDMDGYDDSDASAVRLLALPNLQRFGGIPALLSVSRASRITCWNAARFDERLWPRTAAALERRRLRLLPGAFDPFTHR